MGLDMYLYGQRNLPEEIDLTSEERDQFNKYGEAHISGYSFYPEAAQKRFREVVEAAGLQDTVAPDTPSGDIMSDGDDERDGFMLNVCVGYWRKANQIHQWFVDEVQDGIDECQTSPPIPREKLLELRNLCARILGKSELVPGNITTGLQASAEGWEKTKREGLVIANPELAQEHLPTQDGFFFGSTDYDEYYAHDLQHTISTIDRVLQKAPDDVVLFYHSSW